MKKGIDISYHQGSIDFKKVKADGIEFIIPRSSYGQTVDPKFHSYVKSIKKNDISILGVYHFMYALNESDALANAKFCIKQVQKAGLGKDIYIFCDYEYDTVNYAKRNGVILDKDDCNTFTEIFCEYVKSQGYKTGIYTNNDYYTYKYDKDMWARYPLWLADYAGDPDHPCLLQQTSSRGSVDGISGNVDMNVYYGEEPEEEELKDVTTIAKEVIDGKWGVGTARKNALEKAGYNYTEVQTKVNELMGVSTKKTAVTASQYAQKFSKSVAGTYKTTADLYLRDGAGEQYPYLCTIPVGTKVQCYGYYNKVNGRKWLYIQVTLDGVLYTGFSSSAYLTK